MGFCLSFPQRALPIPFGGSGHKFFPKPSFLFVFLSLAHPVGFSGPFSQKKVNFVIPFFGQLFPSRGPIPFKSYVPFIPLGPHFAAGNAWGPGVPRSRVKLARAPFRGRTGATGPPFCLRPIWAWRAPFLG